MLCEWLLYCSCVVTVIQLYVAQCYVSGYYIVHMTSRLANTLQETNLSKVVQKTLVTIYTCTTCISLQYSYFAHTVSIRFSKITSQTAAVFPSQHVMLLLYSPHNKSCCHLYYTNAVRVFAVRQKIIICEL